MIETDALAPVEKIAGELLQSISAAGRRAALRTVARTLQKGQRARIGRQQDPDGKPFAPRKPKKPGKPGAHPLYFLYPKGEDRPKLVILGTWERRGDHIEGFDTVSGEVRTYLWERIARFLPPDPKRPPKQGSLRRKGAIRRQAMFRKLRQGKYLRAGASAEEAWVGFSGAAARIARVHQEGGQDAPHAGGKKVRYPRRQVLGVTEADREQIMAALLEHLAHA